jgi:hypothetical protein
MAGDFDGDRQQDLIVSESRYPGTPASGDQGAVLIARGSYLGNLQPVHTEIQVAPAGASTWLTGAMAAIDTEADESGQGPASFMVIDPDGNPILFDQHV